MRINYYLTTLVAAGAAASAIAAAPLATADSGASCGTGVPGSICETPGNVQINDSLAPDFAPQYPDFSLFGLGRHRGAHR